MQVVKFKSPRLLKLVFLVITFYFLYELFGILFTEKNIPSYQKKCNINQARSIIEEMCDIYKNQKLIIGSMCASLCNPRNRYKFFDTYKLVGCYNSDESHEYNPEGSGFEFKTVLVYGLIHKKYLSANTPDKIVVKTIHRSFYDFNTRTDPNFEKKPITEQLKFLVALIRQTLASNFGVKVDDELIQWLKRYISRQEVITLDKRLLTERKDLFYYVKLFATNNYDYFEEALRNEDRVNLAKFINNFAALLSQDEYLFSKYFANKKHTLKMYGTCGHFYGIEHAESVGYQLGDMSVSDRKQLALKFLDLVRSFDKHYLDNLIEIESEVLQEKIKVKEYIEAAPGMTDKNALVSFPVQICDVKLDNFGVSANGDLKLIDTDMVHPDSYIYLPKYCENHDDCHYFDCKSFCNFEKKKCNMERINNNLQSICEKIFDNFFIKEEALLANVLVTEEEKSLLSLCSKPSLYANTNIPLKTDNDLINRFKIVLMK